MKKFCVGIAVMFLCTREVRAASSAPRSQAMAESAVQTKLVFTQLRHFRVPPRMDFFFLRAQCWGLWSRGILSRQILPTIALRLFGAVKNFEKVSRLDSLMFLVTLVAPEDSHRMPNLPSGTASNHGFRQTIPPPTAKKSATRLRVSMLTASAN